MAIRMTIVVIACLVATLFTAIQGQDVDRINQKFDQKLFQQSILDEYGTEDVKELIKEPLLAFKTFFTDPSSMETMLNAASNVGNSTFPLQCLEAAWNLRKYNDSFGLPLIVDVIDAFGKIGPGMPVSSYKPYEQIPCLSIVSGCVHFPFIVVRCFYQLKLLTA